ncbi:MAG: hypothetical protein ACJA1A_003843, partial [Saprospiraceae bacterium]
VVSRLLFGGNNGKSLYGMSFLKSLILNKGKIYTLYLYEGKYMDILPLFLF